MPSTHDPTTGTRRGLAKNLTLDHEAVRLLEAMSIGKHAQGRLLSELIRREALRRADRAALKVRIKAVCQAATEPLFAAQVLAVFDEEQAP